MSLSSPRTRAFPMLRWGRKLRTVPAYTRLAYRQGLVGKLHRKTRSVPKDQQDVAGGDKPDADDNSDTKEEDAVVEAVADGATGYLQKETDRDCLLSALRERGPRQSSSANRKCRKGVRGDTRRRKDGKCRRLADFEGAGDTRLLRLGYVLRPDSGGEGN